MMVKPLGHIAFNILRVPKDLQMRKGGRGVSGIHKEKHSVNKQSVGLAFSLFLKDQCMGTTS